MELNHTGKVALMTGAGRGIGLATARVLQREGATVVAATRSASAELAGTGVTMIQADLTDPEGVAAVVAQLQRMHGRLDLLVNNVGGGTRLGLAPFAQLDDGDWRDAWETNLMSAVRVTRATLPLFPMRVGQL